MKTKQILILVIVSLSFLSCNKNTNSDISGSYVSDSYFQKDEGYDWVKVDISSSEKNGIVVAIRSRTDKKKPTCTFDGTLEYWKENLFICKTEQGNMLFQFDDSNLNIKEENPDEIAVLYYNCSGGGSLKGLYTKIQ
jgi:hypothetical protein